MPASTPAAHLRIALDNLFDLGEQMMRARLSREHPEWSDPQVHAAIEEWLRSARVLSSAIALEDQ